MNRTTMPAARHQLARMLLACAFAVLSACASMGPPLSSATPEELASQDVRLGVRTFAPDGRLFLGDDQQGAVIWIAPVGLMQ